MGGDEQMARDNARDYRAKAKFDAAAQALRDVLTDDDCKSRLGPHTSAALTESGRRLKGLSDHIVAVWD